MEMKNLMEAMLGTFEGYLKKLGVKMKTYNSVRDGKSHRLLKVLDNGFEVEIVKPLKLPTTNNTVVVWRSKTNNGTVSSIDELVEAYSA